MLAAEADMPAGSDWAFEFVWDGLRAVAYLAAGRTRLLNGVDRSITASYPDLAVLSTLADRHGPLVLDGQIVALDQVRRPSTQALRQRTASSRPSEGLLARVPVNFYAFDLLFADGEPTLELPYRRRRELLEELDLAGLPVQRSPYFLDVDGQTVLHAGRGHGLAGVVAKRLDSRYQPGRRSRAWVETVPRHTQRVVLGGWLPVPDGDGAGQVGALLVGIPGPSGLRYVGRVRPDAAARRLLAGRVDALARPENPFHDPPPTAGGTRWLLPVLVGEVSYRRWEADGRLRHAGWLGLCEDAHPASVRDPVVVTATPAEGSVAAVLGGGPANGRTGPPESAPVASAPAAELTALDQAVRLAHAEVRSLRAQISPHFVYNALTTISVYVRTDPSRARELLLDFAEYTRYSFRVGAEPTTLGIELANCSRYLALEAARFGDRLRVEVDVPAELRAVPLPFLSLQPVVEHAVRHGIEGTTGGGTLRVKAVRDDEACVVTVSEDATADATAAGAGVGAAAGAASAELAALLVDVRGRLDAAPGPAATLQVGGGPPGGPTGAGTTITLRLPLPAGRLGR
jgi:bifunctional non-homologous end joining protein LigD